MKKSSFYVSLILFSLLVFGIIGSFNISYGDQVLKTGTVVWAEWTPNAWYHGKIASGCDNGYNINFDDGDKKCCTIQQIAVDIAPSKNSVSSGTKVLAKWSNGKFYPGTVNSVSEGSYTIHFDDGDKGSVDISQIRLIGK